MCPFAAAEGDAFHVAFKDVQAAVLFCMEVQYQASRWGGAGVGCVQQLLVGGIFASALLVGSISSLHVRCSSLFPHRSPSRQMMELEWPREVLRLGPCKEIKAPDGSLAYR